MRITISCFVMLGVACGGGHDATVDAPSADAPRADASGPDAAPDAAVACAVQCGAVELCDSIHAGLDDDCNGVVDEGCPCIPGQASRCFAGDPTSRELPGCFDGVMRCEATSTWGACVGGRDATDSPACSDPAPGCHPITALPFAATALSDGVGNFDDDAVTGQYTVACPPGTEACPAPGVTGSFVALQSGEYTVTYEKTVAGGAVSQCDFPLVVGARGLRVELQWEHDLGGNGVDLDLHLHQPANTQPHSSDAAQAQDCMWSNCAIAQLATPGAPGEPAWFSPTATPPDPVSWYLDPTVANNTCYVAPAGRGALWQGLGLGCHNPRLDVDTITCDAAVTDPDSAAFCAPENINVDYMPVGMWTRISVAYYSNQGLTYAVHPHVRVYFDGALAADLGPRGFYAPETAVTFTAAGGAGTSGNTWWMVADVEVVDDGCGQRLVVQPIYQDAGQRTPYLTTFAAANASLGPAYPP